MVLPSGDFARVTHFFGGVGAPLGAAVQFMIGTDAIAGDLPVLADALHDAWVNGMLSQQTNAVQLEATLVKLGPDQTGASVLHGEIDVGTIGGAGTSPQVSYLVHKNTAAGGRRGRGRMFVPGVAESDVATTGALTGARVTALNNALAAWSTDVNNNVLHVSDFRLEYEPSGPEVANPTPVPSSPHVILSFTADSQVATQRRRNRR